MYTMSCIKSIIFSFISGQTFLFEPNMNEFVMVVLRCFEMGKTALIYKDIKFSL